MNEPRFEMEVFSEDITTKGSLTAGVTKEGRAFMRPSNSRKTPSWKKAIADEITETLKWGYPLPEAPYDVRMMFWFGRGKGKPTYQYPTMDVDKLARFMNDELVRGGVMSDDKHITNLVVAKAWRGFGPENNLCSVLIMHDAAAVRTYIQEFLPL